MDSSIQVFNNYKDCIDSTGVSRKLLQWAKKEKAPGFVYSSGSTRVNWTELEPWLKINRSRFETFESKEEASITKIKLENLIKDGVLKDLQIKKLKREYLDPTEVKSLLQTISTSQAAVLKRIPTEYPQKLAGKGQADIEIELSKLVNDVIGIFKSGLENWK
jgi:hypothetical protein